eukprot:g50.t1
MLKSFTSSTSQSTLENLPSFLNLLNTTAWKDIAPKLAEKYPGKPMYAALNFTTMPTFQFYENEKNNLLINASTTLDVILSVHDDNNGFFDAFELSCPLDILITPRIALTKDSQAIRGNALISEMNCNFSLVSSSIGTVEVTLINVGLDFIKKAAMEKLNFILSKGVTMKNTIESFTMSNVTTKAIKGDDDAFFAFVGATVTRKNRTNILPLETFMMEFLNVPEFLFFSFLKSQKIQKTVEVSEVSKVKKNRQEEMKRTPPIGSIDFPFKKTESNCTINIVDLGAIPGKWSAAVHNKDIMNQAFSMAGKHGACTVLVPKTKEDFYIVGGINANGVDNMTVKINGVLRAVPDFFLWPKPVNGAYSTFMEFQRCDNLTITSDTKDSLQDIPEQTKESDTKVEHVPQSGGLIDGQGKLWWNKETIGSRVGGRPMLLIVANSRGLLVEKIELLNSPYWTFNLNPIADAEIRYVRVTVDKKEVRKVEDDVRVTVKSGMMEGKKRFRKLYAQLQPEALNTDGIDISGMNVWIHHCRIHNDDDSIAVKPVGPPGVFSNCTENIVIEDSEFVGYGASIGSVPPRGNGNCVKNVIFRNITMPGTGKGIYVKSNPSCTSDPTNRGLIQNITYVDFTITQPTWWPIWIGPQQQEEPGVDIKQSHKCPLQFPIDDECPTQGCVTFSDITLKNIRIIEPVLSPGAILGNSTNPMKNIIFDNVTVIRSGSLPFEGEYLCKHAGNIKVSNSNPMPKCLT